MPTLKQEIAGNIIKKTGMRTFYAPKGASVKVIADHDNVQIIEYQGDRMPCKTENLEYDQDRSQANNSQP